MPQDLRAQKRLRKTERILEFRFVQRQQSGAIDLVMAKRIAPTHSKESIDPVADVVDGPLDLVIVPSS
jgi:hypothetical protein